MIRAVTIDFDVNVETKEVTNVKVQVEGQVKRKTTTRKRKDVVREIEDFGVITREDNRISFNNKVFDDMKLEVGQRVAIEYTQIGGKLVPIIGTDTAFEKEGIGNKLTKGQTISFRGGQNTVLAEYGTEFTIKEYEEGIWQLISTSAKVGDKEESTKASETATVEAVKAVEEITEQIPADLITEDDEDELDINELTFEL